MRGGARLSAQVKTGTALDRILEARRAAVEHRKKVLPETALRYGVKAATPLRDFSADRGCARRRAAPRTDFAGTRAGDGAVGGSAHGRGTHSRNFGRSADHRSEQPGSEDARSAA